MGGASSGGVPALPHTLPREVSPIESLGVTPRSQAERWTQECLLLLSSSLDSSLLDTDLADQTLDYN